MLDRSGILGFDVMILPACVVLATQTGNLV